MIKTLGPTEDKGFKLEMMGEDVTLITDPEQVLGNWKDKYQDLLNPAPLGDIEFKEKVVNELEIGIDDLAEADYNQEILVGEIDRALRKSKNGQAAGIDKITNEVLKQDAMLELLLQLFNLCFSMEMVPNQWLQAIILPIPKGMSSKATDPPKLQEAQPAIMRVQDIFINAKCQTEHLSQKS